MRRRRHLTLCLALAAPYYSGILVLSYSLNKLKQGPTWLSGHDRHPLRRNLSLHLARRDCLLATVATVVTLTVPPPVRAACLSGDLSPSCIGVYKVPDSTDEDFSAMVSKESLRQYAPDLKFVPRVTVAANAKEVLKDLDHEREMLDNIRDFVSSGNLEGAGIQVLSLLSKLSPSGRMLIDSLATENDGTAFASANSNLQVIQDLRRQQLSSMLETADVAWRNVDVMIGQGLRGDLGVSAVAQISILSELKEATNAYDEFLLNIRRSLPP
jgi:hypothetical protein